MTNATTTERVLLDADHEYGPAWATREPAACVTCGYHGPRTVIDDYGRDVSTAADGCPRCHGHDVRDDGEL